MKCNQELQKPQVVDLITLGQNGITGEIAGFETNELVTLINAVRRDGRAQATIGVISNMRGDCTISSIKQYAENFFDKLAVDNEKFAVKVVVVNDECLLMSINC